VHGLVLNKENIAFELISPLEEICDPNKSVFFIARSVPHIIQQSITTFFYELNDKTTIEIFVKMPKVVLKPKLQ
jgi:hypothetical protein